MPTFDTLLAFTVAATVLVVISVPGALSVVGSSIAHGRRVGVLSVIGADAGERRAHPFAEET